MIQDWKLDRYGSNTYSHLNSLSFSLQQDYTTPLVQIVVKDLKDFDFESVSCKFDTAQTNGVYVSISSECDLFNDHNNRYQFKTTSSRSCCSTIHFEESILLAHIPDASLALKFEVRTEDGFRDTVFGVAEYLFNGGEFLGLLQIRDEENTLIGILSVDIRFVFPCLVPFISLRWLSHQNMVMGPSHGAVGLSQSRHHTPNKGRIYRLQQNEDVETRSESDTSGDINQFEDDFPQEISYLVRTISRNVTTSIKGISINISYERLSSSLELFHRISQSTGTKSIDSSVKISEKLPDDTVAPSLVIQHSGKLIRRCGDCMSSVITSKILQR